MVVNEFGVMIQMEVNRRPLPDYLEKIQKDVTANMRGILVDWLVLSCRGIEASFRYTLPYNLLH